MKKLALLLSLTTALPVLADIDRPPGWLGAYEVYSCHPEEWFLNSQGIWQNPTCVNISGGGNPAPAPGVLPPDEDDEDGDPVDDEDEDDEGEDEGEDEDDGDDCACLPDPVEEPTAQV